MTGTYAPPVHVSPLIRGARWILLGFGIFYGISKRAVYSKMAEEDRQIAAEKKIIRDAEIAEQKRIQALNEQRALALLSQNE